MINLLLSLSITGSILTSISANPVGWSFAGPSTYATRGDDPEHPPLTAAGAAQDIVPGANGTWFLGSVNGGVWRTTNFQDTKPTWKNVLDDQPVTCQSIAALHVSKYDPKRIYAGCGGSTSSMNGEGYNVLNSGEWTGVMFSNDNGDSWKMTSFPTNYYVTDILETDSTGTLLVSAQSNLMNENDGGIWMLQSSQSSSSSASSSSSSSFVRVSKEPTFTLTQWDTIIVATHPRNPAMSVSSSNDKGATWTSMGEPLGWDKGAIPFYTCATVVNCMSCPNHGRLVVAGMTRTAGLPNNTNSQFFVTDDVSGTTWEKLSQPTSMDEDAMPKDRMAILGDPSMPDLMYVAGNAGALAWRVNITTGTWTQMWDAPDVTDGTIPHGDCRNYAWDAASERLILVSDGGVFARVTPRSPGGTWVSLNGDYASMELLSAHYAPREGRYVAGAQDNCAQVTPNDAVATDVAIGFVEGDGTVTLVDNVANPARLFGTTQFLGVGTIDIDPSTTKTKTKSTTTTTTTTTDDDDDGCGGLCFVQGKEFINVPIDHYFPRPSSFPFFVSPYALNVQDPTLLVFWANGTGPNGGGVENYTTSGFYSFSLPHGQVHSKDDIEPPSKVVGTDDNAMILDFVAGGYVDGVSDPTIIVAMSNEKLYLRNKNTGGKLITRSLPTKFALPIIMEYDEDNDGARILGPVTHGRTVSLTVSPSNANVIVVTGWSTVLDNLGKEQIFLTEDGGVVWKDVTGNLRAATGVVGKIRPSGVLLVDLLQNKGRALLVGTTVGVFVTYLEAAGDSPWSRFGSGEEFPIVMTSALSYEHISNKIVAATFGRGIYVVDDAKTSLLKHRLDVFGKSFVEEESSSKYFPTPL